MPKETFCRNSAVFSIWLPFFILAAIPVLNTTTNTKKTPPKPDPAEQAFWNMDYLKADSIYTAELASSPGNAELYWKKSRLQISIAEGIDYRKKEEQQRDFRKAEEYARKSIGLDSTSSRGHAWLAASLGMMSDHVGARDKLKKADEIKRE
ncbi:MAG: hypothetical protein HGA70_02520, partial [Chlorobiaceae bacterium]|nr:hypothetical protein [Chlorobiaceae bacterium]